MGTLLVGFNSSNNIIRQPHRPNQVSYKYLTEILDTVYESKIEANIKLFCVEILLQQLIQIRCQNTEI